MTSRLAEKVEHFFNKPLTLISEINNNIQNKRYLSTKDFNTYLSICIKKYDLFNMIKILDEKTMTLPKNIKRDIAGLLIRLVIPLVIV